MSTEEIIIFSAIAAAIILTVFKAVNYSVKKDREYRERISQIKKSDPVQQYLNSLFYYKGEDLSMDHVSDSEIERVLGDLIRGYTFSKIDKTTVKVAIHQAIMEHNEKRLSRR